MNLKEATAKASWRSLRACTAALFVLAGCGAGAGGTRAAVAKALSLTKAAGTAHFELVLSSSVVSEPTQMSAEVGVVDFADEEESFVVFNGRPQASGWYEQAWLSGTKEYDYFPGEPAAKVSPSTTALPLGALAYPLLAIDSRESTSELGHRQLHGTATTEYLLQAPASTEAVGGIRVGAHGVKLWLDSRGRIKQVSYTEPLTTPGSAAAGPRLVKSLYTETLAFSGFGETVNTSMPTALDHR